MIPDSQKHQIPISEIPVLLTFGHDWVLVQSLQVVDRRAFQKNRSISHIGLPYFSIWDQASSVSMFGSVIFPGRLENLRHPRTACPFMLPELHYS